MRKHEGNPWENTKEYRQSMNLEEADNLVELNDDGMTAEEAQEMNTEAV